MKLSDNKKMRNIRARKEKWNARDSRENEIGVDTGFTDRNKTPILAGSVVIFPDKFNEFRSIVLWDRHSKCYAALRGCWYANREKYDADSYGKAEYHFTGSPCQLLNMLVVENPPKKLSRKHEIGTL